MRWYILCVPTAQLDEFIIKFNSKKHILAFIPQFEYWRRDCKGYTIKPLFTGCIFIKTELKKEQLDKLQYIFYKSNPQIVQKEVVELTKQEIKLFEQLFDEFHIIRMSKCYLNDCHKAVIDEGPLKGLDNNIIKFDKHNQLVYLDIGFMNMKVKAVLKVNKKK